PVVELWQTRDGLTWHKHAETTDRGKGFTVNVPEEGRYGFKVVVRRDSVASQPQPRAGEQPQVWVDVNVTPPVIALLEPERFRREPKPKGLFDPPTLLRDGQRWGMILHWRVTGTNLTDRPITLSYAATPNGPWTPIAANVANTGRYNWFLSP